MKKRIWTLLAILTLAVVFVPPMLAPPAYAQDAQLPPITPNAIVIAGLTWVLTVAFKKWKPFPNDMLPQIAFWIAQVAAYAYAVVQGVAAGVATALLGTGTAWAQTVAVAPQTSPADTVKVGTVAFAVVSVWELFIRKLVWRKLVWPLLSKANK